MRRFLVISILGILSVACKVQADLISYTFDGHAETGQTVTGSFDINTAGENWFSNSNASHYNALENCTFNISNQSLLQYGPHDFDIAMTNDGVSASYTPVKSGPSDNSDSVLDIEMNGSPAPDKSLTNASNLDSRSFSSRTWAVITQAGSSVIGDVRGTFDHIFKTYKTAYAPVISDLPSLNPFESSVGCK